MAHRIKNSLRLILCSRFINGLIVLATTAVPFMALAQKFDTIQRSKIEINRLEKVRPAEEKAKLKAERIGLSRLTNDTNMKVLPKAKSIRSEVLKQQEKVMAKGGVDSGGGSLVTRHGQTGLLDLYLYNQNSFYDKTAGLKLPRTTSLKAFGIDRIVDSKSAVLAGAVSVVTQWQMSSPVVADMVLKALYNLPLYYMNYQLGFVAKQFDLPEETDVNQRELTTAAVYVGQIGVFVSLVDFEKLSATNQVALMIHEALRHAQITYKLNLSNDYIQRLTAALMASSVDKSLDQMGFIQGQLLISELDKIIEPLEIADVVGRACDLKQSMGLSTASDTDFCAQKDFEIDFKADVPNQYLAIIRKVRALALLPDDGGSLAQMKKYSSVQTELFNLCQNLNTKSVSLVLDRAIDPVMSLNKVFSSPLDIFIDNFNEKGWLMSPTRIQAVELRDRFLQNGIFK